MVALREKTKRPYASRSGRVGIWITILYSVYLYGEKCSGITVRSLRSAVPAGLEKANRESRGGIERPRAS